jgi:hypothetical protein
MPLDTNIRSSQLCVRSIVVPPIYGDAAQNRQISFFEVATYGMNLAGALENLPTITESSAVFRGELIRYPIDFEESL